MRRKGSKIAQIARAVGYKPESGFTSFYSSQLSCKWFDMPILYNALTAAFTRIRVVLRDRMSELVSSWINGNSVPAKINSLNDRH